MPIPFREPPKDEGSDVGHIHPTAVIDPRSRVGADVTIGPFCVIEPDVVIGDGCRLASHVVIKSGTTLGRDNQVFEGAVLGGRPQHLAAGGVVGGLCIGDGNIIRENATIHAGLKPGDRTVLGDGNMIMVNAHIGHDCWVGDRTIITNNAMIAGHVHIESRAYISGAAGIHQFCRVGQLAMVGAQAHISQDIPPFVTIDGLSSTVVGLNLIGLRRNGYRQEDILELKAAYRVIYRSGGSFEEILATLRHRFPSGPAAAYYDFLKQSKRGYVRERRGPARATIKLFTGEAREDAPMALCRAG